jgi:hypothetical protein
LTPTHMTEELTNNGGENQKSRKLSALEQLAIWYLRLRAGDITRDDHKDKGKAPPSRGIVGPINHGEDGHPWVWMKVNTLSGYSLKTASQRNRLRRHFEAALKSFSDLGPRGADLDLQVQAVPYDLDAVEASLEAGMFGDPSEEIRENHAKSRKRARKELAKKGYKQRQVFVGVKMRDERSFIHRMIAQLMLSVGFPSSLANGTEEEIYREQIQEIVDKFVVNGVSVRLLTGAETARVIQRCVYRGHSELPEVPDQSGIINTSRDLHRLSDSVAIDHHGVVEIKQDGVSRYAIYQGVAKMEEEFNVNWLFAGDKNHRPVDVSARIHIKDLEKSKDYNNNTIQILENALNDLGKEAKELRSWYQERLDIARNKKDRLKEGVPEAAVNAFLVVSADSEAAAKSQARYVKARLAKKDVVLEVDESYGAEIRRQTYPGAHLTYHKYEQQLFIDGLAWSMPHATTLMGNGGDLLGEVVGVETGPFFYAHRFVLKKERDAPTGQVHAGPSGGGKTSEIANEAFADAEAGMAVIYDEGKGGLQILEKEKLLAKIRMLDLSRPEMAGLLNPLFLGDDDEECRDITVDALIKSAGTEAATGWRPLIKEVVSEEIKEYGDDRDMDRIIYDRLFQVDKSDPDYQLKRSIGRALKDVRESKHSAVIYGKTNRWRDIAKEYITPGQVTFVIYGHLTPPETEKADKDLTGPERLAFLVRDLTNVIYRRIAIDTDFPVAIKKDEIQIDNRMGGSAFSGHLSRIGRSKDSTITLGCQLLGDVPEDFWANCSSIWIYGLKQRSECKLAIERLGINVESGSAEEERLIELLMEDGRGKYVAIVKTMDNQIGLVKTNQLYHEGRFISNLEGIRQRQRYENALAAVTRLPFVRRVETPAAAEEALMSLGVPLEVFGEPNGHADSLKYWTRRVRTLRDDELVAHVDGRLEVITVRRDNRTAPNLPLLQTDEDEE